MAEAPADRVFALTGVHPCREPGASGERGWAIIAAIARWIERRRTIHRRWQADARALVATHAANVYYEAQRRAARARVGGDAAEFYHWAKVAAEVARIAPLAEMDLEVVRDVVREEERRQA